MLTYTLQVQGLDRLQQSFSHAPQLTASKITTAMKKSQIRLQGTAKELAPVDNGTLRGSILLSPVVQSGNTFTASVGTSLNYGLWQEQGSGLYGPYKTPIRPKTKPMLAWKTGNTWHFAKEVKGVRPKWYMRGSMERNEPAIQGYFNTAADEVARALAGGMA